MAHVLEGLDEESGSEDGLEFPEDVKRGTRIGSDPASDEQAQGDVEHYEDDPSESDSDTEFHRVIRRQNRRASGEPAEDSTEEEDGDGGRGSAVASSMESGLEPPLISSGDWDDDPDTSQEFDTATLRQATSNPATPVAVPANGFKPRPPPHRKEKAPRAVQVFRRQFIRSRRPGETMAKETGEINMGGGAAWLTQTSPLASDDDQEDNSWDEETFTDETQDLLSGQHVANRGQQRQGSAYSSKAINSAQSASANSSNHAGSHASLTRAKSGPRKPCSVTWLGGCSAPVGPGSQIKKNVCDHLRCTSCNFKVERFQRMRWSSDVDWLFLRNHMPHFEKVKPMLQSSALSCAYACQCSWRSIAETKRLEEVKRIVAAKRGSKEPEELKWVCMGHALDDPR